MKLPFPKQDLLLLKTPLIVLTIVLILSTALYQGTMLYQESSTSSLRIAQASYQQVIASIEQIEQEESTVVRYIDRYQQLVANGVIGEPNRLQFVEQLSAVRRQAKLYPLLIQIGESSRLDVAYPPEDPLPGDPVQVLSAPLTLTMSLLHEGDMLTVLDTVSGYRGLIKPKSCRLEPTRRADENFDQLAENFDAYCEVQWYNLMLMPPAVMEEY